MEIKKLKKQIMLCGHKEDTHLCQVKVKQREIDSRGLA